MSNTDTFIESPLSSKSPFLTFLLHENNNNNNNNRRQSTMEQLTKGLTNFTLGTKNGCKTITTTNNNNNKVRAVGIENDQDTTPSEVDSDSDSDNIYNIPERLPLRVVNPDPVDSEEEEQVQEHDEHIEEVEKDKEEETIGNKPMDNNSNNNDTIPTKYVIHTISPFSNPSEQKNNHMNNNNYNNDNTIINDNVKPSIVRRQSKTLDEETKPNLLPPVDTTPFNSTHFTTGTSTSYNDYHPITTTNNSNSNIYNDSPTTFTNNNKIVSSSFNQHQQQTSLSPIPESINQPEVLLKPIDSNQINTSSSSSSSPTLLLPNFTSNNNINNINNINNGDTRNSMDYLNSPHPSNVGSTNYAKYTTKSSSKYTKASYSLTNNPGSLSLYRDMAKKTRDKTVQYSYACYLLEIAKLYDQGREVKHNKLTSIKHSLSDASYRLCQELSQTGNRQSIDSSSIKSSSSIPSPPSIRIQSLFTNNNNKNSLPASPTPSISTSTGRSSFQLKGGYQIPLPSLPLSPTATTVDTLITTTTTNNNDNRSFIGSPSPSTYHHLHYRPFNFENNNNNNNNNILNHDFNNLNDNKNGSSNSHRRKKRALEEEGIHWMKRLAKENVPQATFTLATWMDQSLYGFSPNPTKTFALYDIAAKAGNQEAVFRIGLYYESIKDYKNAYQCIYQASENGITQATVKLFKIHLHGELQQRQNMTLAISLLYKATLSADESDPEPFYLFGLILSNTYPDADIPSEVVEQYGGQIGCLPYFEKAVQHGYAPAHSALGYILEHGLYGVQANYAKCYIHYAESSKMGDARGMLGLSRLNNRGSNGPDDVMDYQLRINADESGWLAQREPNEENAFYWCEKAAVEHELSEAEFLLGWYYEIGLGVPRDYSKAQWYYKKAASKGNGMAIKRLLNQENSVSKQQHDLIKNTNVISKNYLDHHQSKNITTTKKRESQQCSIM